MLAKGPATTAMALLTLSLGIGASVTLFSLVDALYLRPLNIPEPSRVVYGLQLLPNISRLGQLSVPDYFYYRDQSQSFSELAAHYPTAPLHVIAGEQPASIMGSVVTANYFSLLQLQPHLGRFFTEAEDLVLGRDAVAVIGHGFWQRHYGGDPQVLGRTLQINGRPFSIVGVAPPGFDGVVRGSAVSQVWIPSAMFNVGYRYCDALSARNCRVVEMIGRLKSTVTLRDAQAEMDVLAQRLLTAFPLPDRTLGVRLVAARGAFPGEPNRDATLVGLLLGGVGLLVLIACANIGGLLLARGSARRKEVTIRLALGAGRNRILRQFLIESFLLAAIGSALGLLVAQWANEGVSRFYAVHYTGALNKFDMAIGAPVLAATAVLCAMTAILCGIAPALQAARTDTLPALKVDSTAIGRPRSRGRDALVMLQVAMSIVLLIGAALLVRSMMQLYGGPGIDPDPVVLMRLRPSLVGHDATRARAFQRAVLEQLKQLPGVEAAAAAENLPLMGGGNDVIVSSSSSSTNGQAGTSARASHVGDDYFKVIGLPLVAGRDFDASDLPGAPRVAIVDDTVAMSLGGTQQVVGQIVSIDGEPVRIVGVARAAQYHSTTEPVFPYVYFNYWQQSGRGFSADSRTHMRVRGDARAMMPALRRAVAAVDPSVPVSEDYPLRERVQFTFQPVRIAMMMLGGFGFFALVLCILGAYGVVAFLASMRTREMAIRLALGADRSDVRRMIVGDGLRLALPGVLIGIVGAFGASRFLGSLLYGVDPHDPGVFVAVPVLLVVLVLSASYLPLRGASRIDPSAALRHE